ncbi:phosphatidate cytidylyltransferase [Mucilaginibacter sp. L3T2-6]|uniref:phosphatidate cytidylyltransferase n=1 Tax=Mucilaginibacter sp. L3T2-6 TaxID=3062491 RepID=UPI0026758782|nr:phosphatidate cytidylyltransferase [Mucilaginibacter sp. L3T2-6]MDO3641820.1 phosphatidate cytidylyltransferase [Mucilaginibacter sp. L3T2-6]MDV6214502.1 phosphatidate cytidylyltransferase [Mucilaginibacter sp. L3T2-6]
MKTRTITGIIFVIVMLASVMLGPLVFAGFYLLISCLCLFEFYGLIKQGTANPNVPVGILTGALIFAAFAVLCYSGVFSMPGLEGMNTGHKLLFLIPVASAAIFTTELFAKSEAPFTNIAYTYLGLIFTVVPFTFFHALAYVLGGFNLYLPLGFLVMLWSNDTGAYLVGRALGRTKLFERHSPKKTWEGFIGGAIISVAAGRILGHYYTGLAMQHWIVIALIISIIGTTGDLVESMLKRSINVKDSGGLLPGHGGLLDRFDGLLLAAPIVYTYLYFISN